MADPVCNGLCLDSSDLGVPGYGIAYPHPTCPLHGEQDYACDCGWCGGSGHDAPLEADARHPEPSNDGGR